MYKYILNQKKKLINFKEKMKSEGIIQFIKFGVVGISNTAVDWLVYYLIAGFLITASDAKPTVKAISFLVAVINSYLWNTIWTFKKEYAKSVKSASSAKSTIFIKFFVVSLVGWGVNYLVFRYFINNFTFQNIEIMARTIKTQDLYPLIFASAAAVIWNFFANKLWTYKK
jgi:putative flippase GtrA